MLIDYGKMAYVKINELNKRIEKLEKQVNKSTYNTLVFDLTPPEKGYAFDKVIKFLSNGDGVVKGELTVSIPESASVTYQIIFQNKTVKMGSVTAIESVITFELSANDGENEVDLKFSSTEDLKFDGLKVTLGGQVEYLSQKRKLSLSTTTFSDYIIYLNADVATLYEYSLGSLVKVCDYFNVLDVSLLGYANQQLYVAVISEENELSFETISSDGERVKNPNVTIKNVSSIYGYVSDSGINVVFSKAGNILVGEYGYDGTFNYQKTGRRGAFVTGDSDVLGVYIIYGEYKPTKLVDYSATYVLEKGENYHVAVFNDEIVVRFNYGGRLYKQTLNGGLSKPVKLSACDEIIRLYDGKYVKRVRDVLTVGKEEDV